VEIHILPLVDCFSDVKKMKESVDRLQVIRSGTTMRDPEVWKLGLNGHEIRDLELSLGVLNLATVTLVETDGLKILIDTSWEGTIDTTPVSAEENRLVMELRYFGLEPTDIDEIFVTHWHGDHWENIYLFPKARVYYAGCSSGYVKQNLDLISADNEIHQLKEGDDWHSGMEIISTDGHSDHDHSIIIHHKGKLFVAAGDAIVSKMYYHTETFFPNDRVIKFQENLRASFRKIVKTADFIIPGHDGPFINYKKGMM
jgi:glyoxylase-like metal-dependent hydrolase (beta-lactamase superfamily II)